MSKSVKQRERRNGGFDRLEAQNHYLQIFYDLFMNRGKFEGEGLTYQQNNFILEQYWNEGAIAAFNADGVDVPVFQPFAAAEWNLYNFPLTINIVPKRPAPFIPTRRLIVDEEVVISYANKSRKPVKVRALYCIKKIVDVEMLIKNNTNTLKMPFLIACSPEDKARMEDVVDKILNDEDVIFTDAEDLQSLKAMLLGTPNLLDNLMNYKEARINELLTLLGINNVNLEKKEHLIVDEANANNQLIESNSNIYDSEYELLCKNVEEVLGYKMTWKPTEYNVEEIKKAFDHDKDNGDDNGGNEE